MRQFATETGLSREAIYKSFRPGGNPTIEAINKALKVARSKIAVRPGESDLSRQRSSCSREVEQRAPEGVAPRDAFVI